MSKLLISTILCLILFAGICRAGDEAASSLNNPTVVDDNDKTSGRMNDIVNSVDMAFKALDLYNAGNTAVKTYNEMSKFKNLGDVTKFAEQQVKGLVTQYKSCKWSFFNWVSNISNKMSDVMAKCNDRVNMWRTTEPTLISYYQAMGKLSNNTLQVFRDFEISDLVDIDRKWSRNMEAQLTKDQRFAYSFFAFATSHLPTDYYQKKYSQLFMPCGVEKELTATSEGLQAYLAIKDNVHVFNQIPYVTLGFASDALLQLKEIADKSHGPSKADPSVSEEEHYMEIIQNAMTDQNATYNDIMDNAVLIETRRAQVATQRIQIQQIYSELQTRYSRLLLRNQEKMAMQYEDVDNTLNKIVNGGTFENIDEARIKKFGTDAGLSDM
jgi:hypothetical protein